MASSGYHHPSCNKVLDAMERADRCWDHADECERWARVFKDPTFSVFADGWRAIANMFEELRVKRHSRERAD